MRSPVPFSILFALLYLPLCEATTVFRCEAAGGRITYSQHGCATDQSQSLQDAYNPTPGSDDPVPLANPEARHRERKQHGDSNREAESLTVVGERQDGCGNRVTGSERRKAMIEGRIKTGMTRADVESTLGKPERISQQNGQVRYQYKADHNHGARTVSFDENGCVRGKK
ncbi:outer membrane protein assembly factor BamE domain-containing protein [Pseudomonas schmalbachii]|uniref:Outer membrane protein assembly factor BamE n=1 Tax=Pseudomonas schmalbachii TaxID=2816993 RepID=A0ABS3TQQ7_9PSED|nr:outer membrane protein assembly factor BamE [Pseudomonas schmalbachii]MBO3275693.1 outer membrane protein assembly factor BamE [Pseudomonas schmalbachii]